ncbi:hypothetical protein [Amycolatopsis nigrescens]|uniref:hypothetical protein n=1 Tax=Amycolatopsis nigrescens TaxID=381445 RepID=UPI000363B82E|nr:hypothetical protein [Amycolatopsis nigrescens]
MSEKEIVATLVDEKPEEPEEKPAEKAENEPETAKPRRGTVLALAAAVLFGGLAGWFAIESQQARGGPAANNTALVDSETTTAVLGQVNDALGRIFSYSFDNPAPTEEAAGQLLTGRAKDQYEQLFAQVRTQAPAQKLTLRSQPAVSGVKLLDGDRATLLAFLDQSSTRADTGSSSVGAAQLSVTAERHGGRWLIADLQAR